MFSDQLKLFNLNILIHRPVQNHNLGCNIPVEILNRGKSLPMMVDGNSSRIGSIGLAPSLIFCNNFGRNGSISLARFFFLYGHSNSGGGGGKIDSTDDSIGSMP